MPNHTIEHLFDLLNAKLNLTWSAGLQSKTHLIEAQKTWGDHPKIIGHMNLIHPNRIQVIGPVEMSYINSLDQTDRAKLIDTLFNTDVYGVILADGIPAPSDFKQASDHYQSPLFNGELSSFETVSVARYELAKIFSEKTTLHGVFMEVTSVGVLLKGDSAVGKSELALELISRGHRLIADDATEFSRVSPEIVSGRCPDLLKDLLEVRGMGILNIRQMYGDGAIKHSKYLRLIIQLVQQSEFDPSINRLNCTTSRESILGVEIPIITLQMAPGRNLAVMVEAAVRSYKLQAHGYDANQELIARHKKMLNHNKDIE